MVAPKDNLDAYYALLKDVLLHPAFNQDDFDRVKNKYAQLCGKIAALCAR